MIAIPDFSSGAMENWGLITYRETALLFNEGVSSEGNRQRVATVVSHELAHQVWRKWKGGTGRRGQGQPVNQCKRTPLPSPEKRKKSAVPVENVIMVQECNTK